MDYSFKILIWTRDNFMCGMFAYCFSLSRCRAACTIKCDIITCDIYHNTLVLVEKSVWGVGKVVLWLLKNIVKLVKSLLIYSLMLPYEVLTFNITICADPYVNTQDTELFLFYYVSWHKRRLLARGHFAWLILYKSHWTLLVVAPPVLVQSAVFFPG